MSQSVHAEVQCTAASTSLSDVRRTGPGRGSSAAATPPASPYSNCDDPETGHTAMTPGTQQTARLSAPQRLRLLDERLDRVAQDLAWAIEDERTTWLAYALERSGGSERTITVATDDRGARVLLDDRGADLTALLGHVVPAWLRHGVLITRYRDDGQYEADAIGHDRRRSTTVFATAGRLRADRLRSLAGGRSAYRRQLHDTGEQLALAAVYEDARAMRSNPEQQQLTFTPGFGNRREGSPVPFLRTDDPPLAFTGSTPTGTGAIAAQAAAVHSIDIAGDDRGQYRFERLLRDTGRSRVVNVLGPHPTAAAVWAGAPAPAAPAAARATPGKESVSRSSARL